MCGMNFSGLALKVWQVTMWKQSVFQKLSSLTMEDRLVWILLVNDGKSKVDSQGRNSFCHTVQINIWNFVVRSWRHTHTCGTALPPVI